MLHKWTMETQREGFFKITKQVAAIVQNSGIQNGLCTVYCPHTTAGLTINENADPAVVQDILLALREAYPERPEYRHAEGNSTAHIKASVMGSSVSVPVESGKLCLGQWQGIYFCEFDGPRIRTVFVKLIEESEEMK